MMLDDTFGNFNGSLAAGEVGSGRFEKEERFGWSSGFELFDVRSVVTAS